MKKLKWLMFSSMFTSTFIFSQQPYFLHENANIPLPATSVSSMDVGSMDVDDDGDLDLIIAAEFGRNLLLINDGSGQFAEDPNRLFPKKNPGNPSPGEDSEDMAFADFNMDGNMDLMIVSEDSMFHELLINDGDGNFSFITYNFSSSLGNAVAVLDLNGDAFPDIIIGNTGQNDVYINNQNLTFTQENNRWPNNNEGTQDLKLVDLDNDGDLDIVEGIDLGSNNILINTNGFFTEENNRLPNTGLTLETRKITMGDVDGQNGPDIFVSTVNFIGTADLQNRLYLNDGNGFFNDATDTHLPAYVRQTLEGIFIDYDFDGDLDLISTDLQSPGTNYHAFENDGIGHFTETTLTVFESFNYAQGIGIHSADFNNDTYPDLYFGNYQETDDILFFSEAALNVVDSSSEFQISTYPNPVQNSFTIEAKMAKDYSELIIRVHDIQGKLVKEINDVSTTRQHLKHTIDLSQFNSGYYFYSLYNKSQTLFNGKIIKQ